MQIDLKLLKTLDALAATGSLQGAAARLFVTQSALSHQLRDIESQLGQPLFVRKSQPLIWSWQGQLLLDLAQEVLPKLQATQTKLTSRSERLLQLKLTVECHACFHWLLPAVKALRQQLPEVNLLLDTEIEHHAIEALLAGELDLVLTTDDRAHQQVAYQPLFSMELKAYLAPEHHCADKTFLKPEDLLHQTLLTYPIPLERQDVFRYFLKKQEYRGNQRQVAQVSQMLQLVAAGEGIAILPAWLAEPYVSQGLIVTQSLGEAGLQRTMYLACRRIDLPRMPDQLFTLLRQHAPVGH